MLGDSRNTKVILPVSSFSKPHWFRNKDLIFWWKFFSTKSKIIEIWELVHKEGWAPKNWCFWTVVLEKTLESPLDCKEINAINPKGNQSWIVIGRTDAKAEVQYFGHLMQRAGSLEKTLMLGNIEGRRRRGQQMRWLDGIINSMDLSLSKLGDSEGQGSLAWCSPWGRKELDRT